MKRRRVHNEGNAENVFALSTGDLMAGLLFIFILLLMGALLQVQEKAEQDEEIVRKYDSTFHTIAKHSLKGTPVSTLP